MSDDEVNRLRIALGRISRSVDRQIAGDGLTRSQLSLLGTVARLRSLGIGELAEIEGMNPTMLSRAVGKLEAKQLVRRSPAADDRRAVVVEITPTGTRLNNRLRRERTSLFAARLRELAPGHSAALLDVVPALESLADALHRTTVSPPGSSQPDVRAEAGR